MFENFSQEEFDHDDFEEIFKVADTKNTIRINNNKIGRNDPCPCGSGKKYKKCCLNKPKSPVELIESEQDKKKWLEEYPAEADEREEGRIYLSDFFDAESIEIDKLIYLALYNRPLSIWDRKQEEAEEKRKRVYLSEAFSKFSEKVEKEHISTFREYDEKYSIHYQCREWFDDLLTLLKKAGDNTVYKEVSACRKNMK